eukprot:12608277-Alexandrium_andersonii.AAC.1
MSASLVGSEMCIRDRRVAMPAYLLAWGQSHGRTNGGGQRWRLALRGPVSYTHLTLPTICSV